MERRKILGAEWSPKNKKDFSEYSNGHGYKAWWEHLCECGEKHIWKTSITHRMVGTECPYCSGRSVCKCNSLAVLRPDLAAQLHPRNGLKAEEISVSSSKKLWWLCSKAECKHPHEWKTTVSSRNNGCGCPYCSGRKICPCNSLAVLRPDLALQWSSKNKVTPEEVSLGSRKKVLWDCNKHNCKLKHEWRATVSHRTSGTNCPYCAGKKICICNSLAALRPDWAAQWHPKNRVAPEEVTLNYTKKIRWLCDKFSCSHPHEWEATPNNRCQGNLGCPYCSGRVVCPCNSLIALNPKLLLEWDSSNKENPEKISINSGVKIGWICKNHNCNIPHRWKARVVDRNNKGYGCPFCGGKKVCNCNSLATLRPDLISEWHPKNELAASQVTSGSSQKAWWVCEKKHEWEAIISNRTMKGGTNCPVCASSKGEKTIKEILEKLNIKYVPQKKINPKPDLRLYLDFYLSDHNLAIEFDGGQHFFPVAYFGGQKTLEKQQLNDAHKNLYCIENGISLLRIHHSEAEEIEKIVRQSIGFYGRNGPWLFLSGLHPKF